MLNHLDQLLLYSYVLFNKVVRPNEISKRPEARCRIVCFARTHFIKIDMTCKLVEKVFFVE